ncbi:M20/M25/M40 family metallo-hydrolase [Alcanivorax sp. DP30]|uniref:M20/M25/M40 family metallo-hydrolase n=1 Tax=Alcanivorax sp. DP30 TaxID=2606217 RepID=UPI00136CD12A|nr:M20/M25/M40 family metallo-hydrolase [Alcanivorax sp. DP30]MZR64503.1 M20/M25/M40 family metallo-hydrolase [Alcanivorax sp. DP30]
MRVLTRALAFALLLLLILLMVLVGRTLMLPSAQSVSTTPLAVTFTQQQVAAMSARLSTAIQHPTLTGEPAAFERFHAFLQQAFPLSHATLRRQTFGHSLLYHWDSGKNCAPTLLLAHQDVVPVSSPQSWQHAPFAGEIEAGYLWGRGTMDDKGSLMAILEAVESLLAQGLSPDCDVWLAFGHDEETGGTQGAARMAAWLLSQGLHFDMVLDEGGMVLPGETLGMESPVALIGIAEKGYISVTLRAEGGAGHSSRPPEQTAIGELARGISLLQDSPRAATLSPPTRLMLEQVAPWQPWAKRLVFANLWLFEPLVIGELASKPDTNALIRTTMAPTMLSAGVKDNVLPSSAEAVINFRLAPGDTQESLLRWLKATLPASVSASIRDGFFAEPSAISSTESAAYRRLSALAGTLPAKPVVAPFLLIAGSDARHYQALSDNVYRFMPVALEREDLARFHGANERLELAQYPVMVSFYAALMRAR